MSSDADVPARSALTPTATPGSEEVASGVGSDEALEDALAEGLDDGSAGSSAGDACFDGRAAEPGTRTFTGSPGTAVQVGVAGTATTSLLGSADVEGRSSLTVVLAGSCRCRTWPSGRADDEWTGAP